MLGNFHAQNLKDLVLIKVFRQQIVILLLTLAIGADLSPEVEIEAADTFLAADETGSASALKSEMRVGDEMLKTYCEINANTN